MLLTTFRCYITFCLNNIPLLYLPLFAAAYCFVKYRKLEEGSAAIAALTDHFTFPGVGFGLFFFASTKRVSSLMMQGGILFFYKLVSLLQEISPVKVRYADAERERIGKTDAFFQEQQKLLDKKHNMVGTRLL